MQWRRGTLMLSWIAYWAAIIVIKLGDGILAAFDARRPANNGSIALNAGDNGLSATVTQAGVETWAGSATFLQIAFWIAGPPLILWAAWLIGVGRYRRGPGGAAAALPEGAAEMPPPSAHQREHAPSERRT